MREQRKEMEEKVGIMDPTTRWPQKWVGPVSQKGRSRHGEFFLKFWDLKRKINNKDVF